MSTNGANDNPTAPAPGTGSAPRTSVIPKTETWGIIFSALGAITVIGSVILQYFVIDHGSSNQLTIDGEVQKSIWAVLTGVVLFIVGFILWILFSSVANKYLAVFLLAFSSFVIGNIAVVMSLYQVTVTKN